jgi:hypothetical protein
MGWGLEARGWGYGARDTGCERGIFEDFQVVRGVNHLAIYSG